MRILNKIKKKISIIYYVKRYNRQKPCHITTYNINTSQVQGVGKEVRLNKGCIFADPNGEVKIGDYTYINSGYIYNCIIGKYCSIGNNVSIGPGEHIVSKISTFPINNLVFNQKDFSELKPTIPTIIGHDVWIGNNAVILQNVMVGDGAVVAAGAVVTKNVPPYAIVGGVPAKVIKYRFDEDIISKLLKIEWWNKNIEWQRSNLHLFKKERITVDDLEHML